jgi:hypothetical protein
VVARSGAQWLVARLPDRLNAVYQYLEPDGRLAVVRRRLRGGKELDVLTYDLSQSGRIEPTEVTIPWPNLDEADGIDFRPPIHSPDGKMVATILRPKDTRVALHAPGKPPGTEPSVFFTLAHADQPPAAGLRSPNPLQVLAAIFEQPGSVALNLSFSPDGTRLLGWNAYGLEVFDVATRTRVFRLRPPDGGVRYAGWVDDDHIVDV